jgi:hypothetical protein
MISNFKQPEKGCLIIFILQRVTKLHKFSDFRIRGVDSSFL